MNFTSRLTLAGAFLFIAACGSNPHYYQQPPNTTAYPAPPPATAYPQPGSDVLFMGDQAPSAPMMNTVRVGNYCVVVTESWTPAVDPATGTRMWLKQVARAPATCQS